MVCITLLGPYLPLPLVSHAMVNIESDITIAIGGRTCCSEDVLNKTFLYNHNYGNWSSGPGLKTARYGHSAGIVIDESTKERLLVVTGGWSGSITLKSTEILIANMWSLGEKTIV